MDEAVRCHRLAMIRNGRRAALGTPDELTEALQNRVIEVATDTPELALTALEKLESVASVAQLGNNLHVLIKAGGPPAEQVVVAVQEALVGKRVSRLVVSPAEPNLEDVFVALTLGESLHLRCEEAI